MCFGRVVHARIVSQRQPGASRVHGRGVACWFLLRKARTYSVVPNDRIDVPKLTAAQRSKAVKRRKEIWEALHPVMKTQIQVGQVAPPESVIGYKQPPAQEKAFAAETAALTGEDKRTINRHIARAEALGDDLDKVAGTSLLATVSVRGLTKLQVRAPCVAGFTPFWWKTSRRPLFGGALATVAFLGDGVTKRHPSASLHRRCPLSVPVLSHGTRERLAKTKWFPDGFDLETVWVSRWPPAAVTRPQKGATPK